MDEANRNFLALTQRCSRNASARLLNGTSAGKSRSEVTTGFGTTTTMVTYWPQRGWKADRMTANQQQQQHCKMPFCCGDNSGNL